jgi:hypothetical protein
MREHSDDEYYGLLVHGRESQSVAAGEAIFTRGDQGDGMYVLLAGSVALKDGDQETPYFAQLVMRVMSQRLRRRGFPVQDAVV